MVEEASWNGKGVVLKRLARRRRLFGAGEGLVDVAES
jgi:hypothetical protein